MKSISFNKPYQLFWGSIPLFCLISITSKVDAVDLELYNTYFVIDIQHLTLLISIIFFGIGILHWLFRNKPLIVWVNIVHAFISILVIFAGLIYWIKIRERFLTGDTSPFYGDYIWATRIILLGLLLFIGAQILFVLNLLTALFRK